MSKNLTRKGLALGAVVALGASLFAGTPASAATSITLDTAFGTSGTTQHGVLGKYFTLASSLVGGADGDKVKFYVEGATAAQLTVKTRLTTDLSGSGSYGNALTRDTALVTTAGTLAAVDNSAKIAAIVPSNAFTAGSYAQVAISLDSAIDATTTIKVTAFVDNGVSNNKPGDAGEIASSPVSITFHKASELTATPTMKSITIGSVVKATVAVSDSVNVEQFRATADGGQAEYPFAVTFKENGSTTFTSGTNTAAQSAIWNKTDKEFVAASVSTATATASKVYGATAYINGDESKSATSSTATAGDVLTLDAVSIAASTSYRSAAPLNSTSTNVIRSGAGSITAKSKVLTVDAGKSVASQKVKFKIAEIDQNGNAVANSIDSGAVITAGGLTLSNSSTTTTQSITVEVVSSSDGSVSLPITYTGLKDGNTIQITATGTGATGLISATEKNLTVQDSKPQAIVDVAVASANTAVHKFAKGGAVSIPFQVVDQFGQVPTGTYQAVFSGLAGVNYTATVPVVDGKVTFTGTDTHTAAITSLTLTAKLQKKDTAGDFNDITTNSVTTGAIPVHFGTVQSASTISIATGNLGSTTGTSAVTRALSSYLNAGNTDVDQGSITHTTAGGITLTSTVLDTEGAQAVGVAVTYTADGVLFKAGNTYGLGSITVLTDASGSTGAVSAFSNLTGAVTVTVTSGSATKTQALTFAKPTSGGTAWTVTAPTSILPGQSLKVTAVLKDKYAGVVNASGSSDVVKVVYSGPGYVATTLPTTTGSDGSISVTVLLGAADTGIGTFTITYAGADTITAATSADDVVATATVNITSVVTNPVAARLAASTKKFYVSVDNAKGDKVVVKVAGKTVKSFVASLTKQTVAIKATKGKKSVKVYVDGDLVVAKTLTIK